MSDEIIKCPKCGSTKTRDSQVKEALETTGKVVGKIASIGLIPISGFLGEAINRGVSKGVSEVTGALTGALWHVRVCQSCGHSWNYLFGTDNKKPSKTDACSRNRNVSSEDIIGEVKKLLVKQLCVEEDEIELDSRLSEDLGADSLDGVELIMEAESKFGIEISDSEAKRFRTVGDLVAFIQKHK